MKIVLAANTPAVFTKTAVEAMIQDQGFSAQVAIASILRGTPVLVAIGAFAWAVHVYWAMAAVTVEGRKTEGVLHRLAWLTMMMLLGWTLLGIQSGHGLVASPIDSADRDEAWQDLPGIAANPRFDALQTPSEGLWGFGMINGVYEEASALLTDAVGIPPEDDPAAMIRTLVRLQATTLGDSSSGDGWGEDILSAFDALARNCGTSDARILAPGASVEALFVTSVDVVGTDEDGDEIDCAMLWTDFEEATTAAAVGSYMDDQSSEGIAAMAGRFGWGRLLELGTQWFGLKEDETTQWAVNAMIEGTLRDAAKRDAAGVNPLRKDQATFSEGWPDYIVDVLVDGPVTEVGLNLGSLVDPNIHLRAQKAEAARRFNEIADLIPTLRGFLFAAFAVAFPLCAYAMALGWWTPMRNWLVGRGVLALYLPAAQLLYGMVSQFAAYNGILDNPDMAWLHSESTVVGALAVMEAETLRVQTAYLMAEVGVFGSFALGSARSLLLGGLTSGAGGFRSFGAGIGAMAAMAQLGLRPVTRAVGARAAATVAQRVAPAAGPATAVVVHTATGSARSTPRPPAPHVAPRTFE